MKKKKKKENKNDCRSKRIKIYEKIGVQEVEEQDECLQEKNGCR